MSEERVLREILSRRDPQGYYVIPADRRALEIVKQRYSGSFTVEEAGNVVFIKVHSRSLAEKVARLLLSKGMLKTVR